MKDEFKKSKHFEKLAESLWAQPTYKGKRGDGAVAQAPLLKMTWKEGDLNVELSPLWSVLSCLNVIELKDRIICFGKLLLKNLLKTTPLSLFFNVRSFVKTSAPS